MWATGCRCSLENELAELKGDRHAMVGETVARLEELPHELPADAAKAVASLLTCKCHTLDADDVLASTRRNTPYATLYRFMEHYVSPFITYRRAIRTMDTQLQLECRQRLTLIHMWTGHTVYGRYSPLFTAQLYHQLTDTQRLHALRMLIGNQGRRTMPFWRNGIV